MKSKLLLLAIWLGGCAPALGAWNPLQIPNVVLYLDAAYTAHQWQESNSGSVQASTPASLTNPVGMIDEPAGGFNVWANGDVNRLTLNGSGGKSWWTGGSSKHLRLQDSTGLRFLTYQPQWWFKAKVRLSTAASGANQVLFDSANSTNGSVGVMVYASTTGNPTILIGNGTSSILTSAPSSATAMSNNTWHDLIVQVNYAGNLASVQLDTNTAATSTFASTGVNADMTFNLEIGSRQAGTNPWGGDIKHIVMGSGTLSAGDLANLRAWDPDTTSTSLAVPTSTSNSLQPTDVPFLHRWYDTSDTTSLWTTSVKSTPVASDGDKIGFMENKKPIASGSSWGRQTSQSTAAKRPTYKVNQFGSVAAAYFDGASANASGGDWTGEQDLVVSGTTPLGECTILVGYKNLDVTQGSHVLCGGGSRYAVQTGSGYTMGTYGFVVLHGYVTPTTSPATSSFNSPKPNNPEGPNIWGVRRSGYTAYQIINGNSTAANDFGFFDIQHIGRANHSDAGGSWDMYGPWAFALVYTNNLSPEVTQRLMNTQATRLGITEAYRSSGTPANRKISIGINRSLSAVERRQEESFHALAP